ncbi:polysaccharide deacetylase family protein [Streptomyces sp. SID4919]|uniref:polysaccharide deacetylase family protein n=1 Tax=unclassified Streptomyces TaxID=2593676 RepID=UPI000823E155|nr:MULTISPECIES: polysaccharide deacetylase family protein [unclassified Streptomyces]MYY13791.1 polysaccharide deacetylase family protein [Streptomyces sp. SID4919]SCK30308.1 Peptidoglycan/xylan/chitin deacetylase, PgdA/CDA1 family [Streptomyces sp. AmelKG-E11A]
MKKQGRSRTWFGAALATLMSFAAVPGAAQADPGHGPGTARTGAGSDCSAGYVALTFDDGPTASTTAYLKALRDAGQVRATWFVTGGLAAASPEGTRRIAAAGHHIGNHSYTHPDLVSLDAATAYAELRDTSQVVRAQTGRAPTLFRPPFGSTDARTRQDAARLGMTEVIWTADTVDWSGIPTETVVSNALTVRAGGIVLLHDGLQNTLAAIPGIVGGLAERGLCPGRIVRSAEPVEAWPGLTFHAKAARW